MILLLCASRSSPPAPAAWARVCFDVDKVFHTREPLPPPFFVPSLFPPSPLFSSDGAMDGLWRWNRIKGCAAASKRLVFRNLLMPPLSGEVRCSKGILSPTACNLHLSLFVPASLRGHFSLRTGIGYRSRSSHRRNIATFCHSAIFLYSSEAKEAAQ